MLPIGVVRPESRMKGIKSTKENSIACCMLATSDEMNNPMPTEATTNRTRPL